MHCGNKNAMVDTNTKVLGYLKGDKGLVSNSLKSENSVVIAPCFIGDDVIAGGGTKILSNVPAGRVLLGYPALKMETHVQAWKNIRRLPRLIEQVAALRAAVTDSRQGEPKESGDDDEG